MKFNEVVVKDKGGFMITYVFPGQGSQFKGMGAELWDDFKTLTAKADAILGYSLKELCMQNPENRLHRTAFTQPAVFVTSVLHFLKRFEDTGLRAHFLAGHSLGEYAALFASGVFDFEIGVKLVQKRGELMDQAAGGGMAAVMGLGPDDVRNVLSQSGLAGLEVANLNAPEQTVISGPKEEIERAAAFFEKAKARYVPLRVSGAFHSRLMEESRAAFQSFLTGFDFRPLRIPVISNVTARPYEPGQSVENLSRQITHPVRWTESIRFLLDQGVTAFEELGPGDVLTKLIEKIRAPIQAAA